MQQYQSHKVVKAFKIGHIHRDEVNGAILQPERDFSHPGTDENNDTIVAVGFEYLNKHNPQEGGYYVLYPDGYESWSPAEAFEEGYTAVNEQEFIPPPITGYRVLTQDEVSLMNSIKEEANEVELVVLGLECLPDIDQRWVAIGKTHLQQGFMALVRSVARPESF